MSTDFKKCNSHHPDFAGLVELLNRDLNLRYGEIQERYDEFNKIGLIETVIIAYADGIPVGCGCFKFYDNKTIEIKRMFVKKEERGKRIASRILANLEHWAADLGFKKAILETGVNQSEAIALYQKSGYESISNYGQYIGNANSICMSKQLKSVI
jgi:putative acetyltransferase